MLYVSHVYIASHPVTFYRQRGNRTYLINLTVQCQALSKEASMTIYKVFGMTWPGIEPTTSCTPGERSTTGLLGGTPSLMKEAFLCNIFCRDLLIALLWDIMLLVDMLHSLKSKLKYTYLACIICWIHIMFRLFIAEHYSILVSSPLQPCSTNI